MTKGNLVKRYAVTLLAWRRSGPRRHIFGRKTWVQITKIVFESADFTNAELVFTSFHLGPGEILYIVDNYYGYPIRERRRIK